jgi:hypothetical protein
MWREASDRPQASDPKRESPPTTMPIPLSTHSNFADIILFLNTRPLEFLTDPLSRACWHEIQDKYGFAITSTPSSHSR